MRSSQRWNHPNAWAGGVPGSRTSQTSQASAGSRRSSDSWCNTIESSGGSGSSCDTVLRDQVAQTRFTRLVAEGEHSRIGRVVAEGRLKDVLARIERSDAGQLIVMVEAKCHGQTLRSRERGWRARYTEVARSLVRELLHVLRQGLEAAIADLLARDEDARRASRLLALADMPTQQTVIREAQLDAEPEEVAAAIHTIGLADEWDACQRAFEPPHTADQYEDVTHERLDDDEPEPVFADPSEPLDDTVHGVHDDACTESSGLAHAPGVKIVRIEWASELRWGGDAAYDPRVDGDILLEGSCVLENPEIFDGQEPAPGEAWHEASEADLVGALLTHVNQAPTVSYSSWSLRRTHEPTQRTVKLWDDDEGDVGNEGGESPEHFLTLSRLALFHSKTVLVRLHGDSL